MAFHFNQLKNKSLLALVGAFFAIYVFWGASYVFLATAVEDLPPYLLAGIRFLTAGCLLSIFMFPRLSKNNLSTKQVLNSILAGNLFMTLGNGGITWALQYVDSGITALFISSQPLILLFMLWALDRKPLPWQSWLGVALGILGIFLLFGQNEFIQNDDQALGFLLIFFSLLAFGVGSIFVGRASMPQSNFLNTAIQLLAGGTSMILISFIFENTLNFNYESVRLISWISVLYLAIPSGVIAFVSFNYLLQTVSPEKVATATYVNPIIALFLGWWFRDELLSPQSVIATIVLLTGVYFINKRKESPEKHPVLEEDSNQVIIQ